MRRVLVLVWVYTTAAQSPFSLLSALLLSGSRSLLTPSDPVLQPPGPLPWPSLPSSPHTVESLGMTAPPPHPVFIASPQLDEEALPFQTPLESVESQPDVFRGDRSADGRHVKLLQTLVSRSVTPSPSVSTPSTIKFTLDDVPLLWQPQMYSPQLDAKSSNEAHRADKLPHQRVSSVEDSVEGREVVTSPLIHEQMPKQLIILTSEEREQQSTIPVYSTYFPVLQNIDINFKPSLTFPFLEDSTEEPHNSMRFLETRTPVVASFLHTQPLRYVQSPSNIFTIKPVRLDSGSFTDNIVFGISKADKNLSKTPIPKIVGLAEEKESSEQNYKTEKPVPDRKALRFDQELLSLLRNYNQTGKNQDNKMESSTEANLLWFSNESEDTAESVWRLKGGARSPSAQSSSKEDPSPQDSPQNLGGVFATSLRGLMAAAAKSVSTTTLASAAEGPRITSVGEVGQVPHQTLQPPLLSALKHGVQSLNVSAWVSGCPRLYGKVELNCAIHQDALNTAMKMMWKKKTFLNGRVEEQMLAEDDFLKVDDPRIVLKRGHDQYHLVIKDFQSKDCGTYECEARAADTVAASQLLLFNCL